MKVLIILALSTLPLISAEAPRGFRRQFFQRQEQSPSDITPPPPPQGGNSDQDGPYPASNSDPAPYPASGWKPSGAQFNYPEKQPQQKPNNQYGPPQSQQKPPQEYGAPSSTTTTSSPETEGTDSTTTEPESETVSFLRRRPAKQRQQESLIQNNDRGLYYVLLPDGKLQRVIYMTSADLQNMAYTARLRYEDVDPVSAPIYTLNNAPVPIPAPAAALRLSSGQIQQVVVA